jgi:glycosyltransferase involved in cell wall biosynthesis
MSNKNETDSIRSVVQSAPTPHNDVTPLAAGGNVTQGFALPILEAVACGTPVLTSSAASLPEVVGDAGIMVDPYNTEAIADGLVRLVEDSDLREELRSQGLERARQLTWERTAAKTWEVLQEAMLS